MKKKKNRLNIRETDEAGSVTVRKLKEIIVAGLITVYGGINLYSPINCIRLKRRNQND